MLRRTPAFTTVRNKEVKKTSHPIPRCIGIRDFFLLRLGALIFLSLVRSVESLMIAASYIVNFSVSASSEIVGKEPGFLRFFFLKVVQTEFRH